MTGSTGLSRARLARLTAVLREAVDRGEVAGVVTALARRDGAHVDVVGARDLASAAPMTRDTIFRVASLSKPMTAVAAMILVEEARLRLDDPVDRWLPELADREVLRALSGPVDDTVPARRAITVRDLLSLRAGYGVVIAPEGTHPIQRAIAAAGVDPPGAELVALPPDVYMARLGELPLIHQPGEQWLYHGGADILGVLIARVAGTSLGEFLQARVFAPLGMTDTGFYVPEAELERLATCYRSEAGRLTVVDAARGGRWSRPPVFESGGGGLVSTVDDLLAFAGMMRGRGRHGAARILARPTVELMTSDQLTPEQKARSPFAPGFWDSNGWGLGMAVTTARPGVGLSTGSYGWIGAYQTAWFNDPHEDLTVIVLLQRAMDGPDGDRITRDVLTLAYHAIDD